MPLAPDRFPVTRYFPSATRYQLTMGCDGFLWLILSIICMGLAWTWKNIPGMAAAGLAYWVGLSYLRKLGRYDPLMVKVFVANTFLYQLTYGARSMVSAKLRNLPKKWIA